jgi:hypothetical protein
VNDQRKGMYLNDAVVAFPGGIEENDGNLSQNSRYRAKIEHGISTK